MGLLSQIPVSFSAGALSTLSPCVFPILPIIMTSATQEHRLGPIALSGGMALGFAIVGTALASIGPLVGLDPSTIKFAGAAILILFGVFLLIPALNIWLSEKMSRLSSSAQSAVSRGTYSGLAGQFALGFILGMVWTPCTGPTLGAAITIASMNQGIVLPFLIMLAFGAGAAVPLLFIAYSSRVMTQRLRPQIMKSAAKAKPVMGMIFILVALAVITGFDKNVESWVLDIAPNWLTELSTRY